MNPAFVMTMKRPHETFRIPCSLGRRMNHLGRNILLGVLACLTIAAVGTYIYQVNSSASKGFVVRDLEKNLEQLQNSVTDLEDQSVRMQAMHALQERVRPLGYVSVDQMEFIDVAHHSYALAK